MLAENYHSELVADDQGRRLPLRAGPADGASGARVRLLLRRRPRRRLRLPGAPASSRPAGLPHRRDHPQPARQRPAARPGHPLPRPTPASRGTRSTADDVVILPAFGVTVDDLRAARRHRLHPDRHHLRLGAERLEERPALRRGRLHLDHPRQALARGDPGHRVAGGAGAGRPLPGRARPRRGRGWSATTSRHGRARRRARRCSSASATPCSPGFDPDRAPAAHRLRQSDDDAQHRVARDRRDVPRGDARLATARRRAASTSRPSTPSAAPPRTGRTPSCALLTEHAARSDDRDRRLQQQQHLQPGAHLRRRGARPSTSPIPTACCRPTRSAIATSAPRPRS